MITWPSHFLPLKCEDFRKIPTLYVHTCEISQPLSQSSVLDMRKSRLRHVSYRKHPKNTEFDPCNSIFSITLRGQIPVFSGVSDRENDLIMTYAYQESVYNGGSPTKQVIIIMTK